jgi:hypothetical protein
MDWSCGVVRKPEEMRSFGRLDVDGKIILKRIPKEIELDSSASG